MARFTDDSKFPSIGPGAYEVDQQKSPKSKFPKIITVREGNRVVKPKDPERPSPGPGSYDVKQVTVAQ